MNRNGVMEYHESCFSVQHSKKDIKVEEKKGRHVKEDLGTENDNNQSYKNKWRCNDTSAVTIPLEVKKKCRKKVPTGGRAKKKQLRRSKCNETSTSCSKEASTSQSTQTNSDKASNSAGAAKKKQLRSSKPNETSTSCSRQATSDTGSYCRTSSVPAVLKVEQQGGCDQTVLKAQKHHSQMMSSHQSGQNLSYIIQSLGVHLQQGQPSVL